MEPSINGNYTQSCTGDNNEMEHSAIPMTEYKTEAELINKTKQQQQQQQQRWLFKYNNKFFITSLHCLIHAGAVAYFAYSTHYFINEKNNHCLDKRQRPPVNSVCGMEFCSGYGFLMLLVIFIYLGLFYFRLFKPKIRVHLQKRLYCDSGLNKWRAVGKQRIVKVIVLLLLAVAFAVFLFFETRHFLRKLIGLLGPCVFLSLGYIFSSHRRSIHWRTVITGIVTQFVLGVICIRWEVGRNIFDCIGHKVSTFLSYAEAGSRFVFGDTLINDGVFAFSVLPVIFFFSFFISVLYYMNVMQWIVMKLGWLLQALLNTTVCESVNAAANVFLGMSECPLLIRPYIKLLTASELHSIMVSGFATVSGSVLAAYLKFGASAAHLVTSSVMAAPASLALSKLFLPETEESQTTSDNIQLAESEDSSILDAASNGANNAICIILGIIANLVAFVGFITFLNATVNWLGLLVGLDDIDFEWIFSKLFIPLAWIMGVPWKDCEIIAKVIATKTIINEFVAYERLGVYMQSKAISAHSAGIATFAICGFANPSSIGILIGTLGAMAPERRALITSVALRAFVVGTLVCFTSASFAGILMDEEIE